MQHTSDCATHNSPAYPPGPCDCGARTAELEQALRDLLNYTDMNKDSQNVAHEIKKARKALNVQ